MATNACDDEKDGYYCSFGTVPFGTVHTRIIPIRSKIDRIEKWTYTNPLEQSPFTVSITALGAPAEHTVKNWSSHKDEFGDSQNRQTKDSITVKYLPQLPNQTAVFYYEIRLLDGTATMLTLHGGTEGFHVVADKKDIFIVRKTNGKEGTAEIVIRNHSKTGTRYMFTNVSANLGLSLWPNHGRIQAESTVSIKLVYVPRSTTVDLYFNLICLVDNHEPLVFNVTVGVHDEVNFEFNKKIHFTESLWRGSGNCDLIFRTPHDDEVVLGACVDGTDSNRERDHCGGGLKLITLSDYHIFIETDQSDRRKSFTVYNNSLTTLYILWQCNDDNDDGSIFSITPKGFVPVDRGSKIEFHVTYRPKGPGLVHTACYASIIRWGSAMYRFTPPYSVNLYVLGHSFRRESYGWPAEYYIANRTIVMPVTIPQRKVYRTFVIEKLSQLPIMFRFIPGSLKSKYDVYPFEGLIVNDFQIFVIMLRPNEERFTAYIEHWTLMLNKTPVTLEFIGTAESAMVSLTTGSDIVLPNTFRHCCLQTNGYIINMTRHHLLFHIETNSDEEIMNTICEPTLLLPNEMKRLPLWCCAIWRGPLIHYKTTMNLLSSIRYQAIDDNIDSGREEPDIARHPCSVPPTSMMNVLTARCTIVPVNIQCKLPGSGTLDLGDCVCGIANSSYVIVENTSDAVAHLVFGFTNNVGPDPDSQVSVCPKRISMLPNTECKVEVIVNPIELGPQEVKMICLLSSSCRYQGGDDFKSNHGGQIIHLTKILFLGVFPQLKIVDIYVFNALSLVSQYFAWKILNIDNWNKLMGMMNMGEEKTLIIKLLEGEYMQSPIRITMVLKNVGRTVCNFRISRLPCDCFAKMKTVPLKRKKCRHEQINFIPSEATLQADGALLWEVHISFFEPLQTRCRFRLMWWPEDASYHSAKESFVIEILTSAITDPGTPSGDVCYQIHNEPLKLQDVSMHFAMNAPIQAIWLFNNGWVPTEYSVTFHLGDKENVDCFNPVGIVPRKSLHPILIRFTPFEARRYNVTLMIQLAGVIRMIDLTVNGIWEPLFRSTKLENRRINPLPYGERKVIMTNLRRPAMLSLQQIETGITSINSKFSRIVHITSLSDRPIYFLWSRIHMDGLIEVTVYPCSGIIKPHLTATCLISVSTYSLPFLIIATINVKFSFVEDTIIWLKRKLYMPKIGQKFDAQFDFDGSYRAFKLNAEEKSMLGADGSGDKIFTVEGKPEVFYDSIYLSACCLNIPRNDRGLISSGYFVNRNCDTLSSALKLDSNEEVHLVATVFHRLVWQMINNQEHLSDELLKRSSILYETLIHSPKESQQETCAKDQKIGTQLSGLCLSHIFNRILLETMSTDVNLSVSYNLSSSNYS